MDDYQRLEQKAFLWLMFIHGLLILFALNFFLIGTSFGYNVIYIALADGIITTLLAYIGAKVSSRVLLHPFRTIWQIVLHIAPNNNRTPAPNLQKVYFGRSVVTSLANQIYQLGSQVGPDGLSEHRKALSQAANIVSHFPLPLFVLNKDQLVTNASDSTLSYLGVESSELFGQKLFDVVDLEFPGEQTLAQWIADCQDNKVTEWQQWQRVRVRLRDGKTTRLCDIAAYYNRDNESGTEFIITFYDRTSSYGQDETNLSFVALAVHELRTPLTMLRGYIEVLEEELQQTQNQELQDYVGKLRISAEQLTGFVNNVLNVVKVEENQLTLHLSQQTWPTLLEQAAESQLLRAEILGKHISFDIANHLAPVAADPVSISEVVNNLLDNALKYSGDSKEIKVTSNVNSDGLVETSIQDSGVGIPDNVLPNLFEKFYRNHRTRSQFGGTGLGLYLTKAIIGAHGGQIWVKSKVGKGSTFTFTLQPYANLADELKKGDTKGIERNAHGWIKNHSYYRK